LLQFELLPIMIFELNKQAVSEDRYVYKLKLQYNVTNKIHRQGIRH